MGTINQDGDDLRVLSAAIDDFHKVVLGQFVALHFPKEDSDAQRLIEAEELWSADCWSHPAQDLVLFALTFATSSLDFLHASVDAVNSPAGADVDVILRASVESAAFSAHLIRSDVGDKELITSALVERVYSWKQLRNVGSPDPSDAWVKKTKLIEALESHGEELGLLRRSRKNALVPKRVSAVDVVQSLFGEPGTDLGELGEATYRELSLLSHSNPLAIQAYNSGVERGMKGPLLLALHPEVGRYSRLAIVAMQACSASISSVSRFMGYPAIDRDSTQPSVQAVNALIRKFHS